MFCPSSPNWREKGSTFTPAPPPPPTFCFSSLKVPFVTFFGTSSFSPDKFQHDRQKDPFGDVFDVFDVFILCKHRLFQALLTTPMSLQQQLTRLSELSGIGN